MGERELTMTERWHAALEALAEVRRAIPIAFMSLDKTLGEQVRDLAEYAGNASDEIRKLRKK